LGFWFFGVSRIESNVATIVPFFSRFGNFLGVSKFPFNNLVPKFLQVSDQLQQLSRFPLDQLTLSLPLLIFSDSIPRSQHTVQRLWEPAASRSSFSPLHCCNPSSPRRQRVWSASRCQEWKYSVRQVRSKVSDQGRSRGSDQVKLMQQMPSISFPMAIVTPPV
jgi:hypothetical protein